MYENNNYYQLVKRYPAVSRRSLLASAMLGLAALPAASGTASEKLPEKPNVIFILTDDQGYGDLSFHGNPVLKTPHMNKLAEKSVRFEDFVVSPSCSPTRCALMTGMHEFKSGVTHTIKGRDHMSLDSVTVADMLKRGGYATGMFGKWHLGKEKAYRPEKRGFDIAMTTVGDSQKPHFNPTMLRNGKEEKHKGYRTDILFREAIRFIDGHKDRPFFCYLATYSPHSPLVAPEKYVNLYNGKVTDQQATFMGMVTNIDDNIGKLLLHLEKSGLAKKTLIILMNDNGGTFGVDVWNAGMRGHKGNAWYGGTRALSFWHWPGVLKPGTVSDLTGHVDLLPTLAEIGGVKLEKGHRKKLNGFSLVPLLTGGSSPQPERMLFSHVGRWRTGSGRRHKHALCGVRYKQYHLVSNAPCAYAFCRGECRFSRRIMNGTMKGGYSTKKRAFNAKVTEPGQWLLFDVQGDLAQEKNIAEKHPEIVAKMSKAYDAWWGEVSVDWPHKTERTFEGTLHSTLDARGKPSPRYYILKLASGDEIPISQPGVHNGYGWTKEKVPQLKPFTDARVKIKALAYNETKGSKPLVVVRVTGIERIERH
ncbi:MAG: arylsulfatase [Verrucomicrobiae bacterium]|nr:arylsulfatase [Verrucomicrobiae bacterium]NNJ43731.1 arylsulfatase [Akkermansiaceae bacterium]